MRENNELTQFSIYKINIEKVEETILLKEDDDVNSIKNKIIGYLKNYIQIYLLFAYNPNIFYTFIAETNESVQNKGAKQVYINIRYKSAAKKMKNRIQNSQRDP